MQCKNCGGAIHEGDSFCRICAVPVTLDPHSGLEKISNPATNAFMRHDASQPQQQEPVYKNEQLKKITVPQSDMIGEVSDEKYVSKDGNDRVTATITNVLGLVVLIIIIGVIGFILYDSVLKNIL